MKRVLILAPVALLIGCSADRWQGFVYPNKSNLAVHIGIGGYDSLEACRQSAIDALIVVRGLQTSGRITLAEALGELPETDYECGLNCRKEPGMTSFLCDETIR